MGLKYFQAIQAHRFSSLRNMVANHLATSNTELSRSGITNAAQNILEFTQKSTLTFRGFSKMSNKSRFFLSHPH
jgi:hypothetical protein